MRRLLASLVALSAMMAVAPAHAQLSPGYSGFSSAPTEGSDKDYWSMVHQLGYCLSSSKAEESLAFLAAKPGSANEGLAWDELFNERRNPCMQNFVSATMLRGHVRGAIAEAMFSRAMKDPSYAANNPVLAQTPTISDIYDFADCYVAANYEDARGLISETEMSTKGELQYIRQIAGDFGPCLPAGSEVKIVPIDVRFAIAEALFRTTRAPLPAAAAEGGQ